MHWYAWLLVAASGVIVAWIIIDAVATYLEPESDDQ